MGANFAVIVFLVCISSCFCVSNVDKYLDRCVDSRSHKSKPGPEGKDFVGPCKPWTNHSCCTNDTASKIKADGIYSLYSMLLDQCPKKKMMSDKCKRHFKQDTCFYECSPNFAPWIVDDNISKKTRKERVVGVPVCSDDCDQWFEDCKFDYTCSDNWGNVSGWNWKKKGTVEMCKQPCKTFEEYYKDPKTFCERIFNFSYKYGSSNRSECMSMWPKSWKDNLNLARKYTLEKLENSPTGFAESINPSLFRVPFFMLIGIFIF